MPDAKEPERDPHEPELDAKAQKQEWPGLTEKMRPRPDHGEESYEGSGRLKGRKALITGGDSGIGRAVAIAFAREGADVAFTYLAPEQEDAEETARLVEEAGRKCAALACEFVDREHCRFAVERAVELLGGLDILVNNAAYQKEVDDFLMLTEAQVMRTFQTNILAYLWMAQLAVPHLKPGSSIINTGSVTALEGNKGLIDYAATKGAIHNLTLSLAQALADKGIRVNCVAPGPVWTPLIPATLKPEHVARFGEDTRWKRAAQPAEIAPSYVFFASDDGRFFTGETLSPSGKTTTR